MVNSNDTIISALLTSTVSSLEILKELQGSQADIVKALSTVQDGQVETNTSLLKLDDVATKEDVAAVITELTNITNLVTSLDIGSVLTTLEVVEQSINQKINTVVGEQTTTLQKDIEGTNSRKNLEVIKTLVEGLKTMQQNITIVAERMETLNETVKDTSDETKSLTTTMIDSNSRITSMDMRLASMVHGVGQATDVSTSRSIEDSIAFLNQFREKEPGDSE